ncbi:hypothetical protein [Mesorhizobium sp. CN2-181]|uniref:hypothetical protein n=1 Tax=Mesorhizobium yinganensis TaxID=3157707 RepID=UPI0032B8245E
MVDLLHGQVVLYSYLWWREHLRGEETGRKARPCCVMVVISQRNGGRRAILFPITSSPLGRDTTAVAVPDTEARRAKLYTPAWVVVEEFNSDDPENSLALDDAEPLGVFSRKFIGRIAAEAAKAARAKGIRAIPRG